MRLPLMDEKSKKVDMDAFKTMVDYFMDCGYNYFDTAHTYLDGNSEKAIKEALVKRYPRNSYVLADKLPIFNITKSSDMEKIFNQQLERTGVEYFDYYMLHNASTKHFKKFTQLDSFKFIKEKKNDGKVKHIGISSHDGPEFLEKLIKTHPEIEFVQLQINYLDWQDDIIQSKKCYEVAKKYGLDVIVMEPLKGGALLNIPDNVQKIFDDKLDSSPLGCAFDFCKSLDSVKVVLSGMNNINQVRENIEIFEDNKLNRDDMSFPADVVEEFKKCDLIQCTSCDYCINHCPQNIKIPEYLKLYNTQKLSKEHSVKMYYNNMITQYESSPVDCLYCANCTDYCPQKLDIPKYMKEISEFFS